MIFTSPAQVGPPWFSDLFFFLLAAYVRAMEIFYGVVDAVGWYVVAEWRARS